MDAFKPTKASKEIPAGPTERFAHAIAASVSSFAVLGFLFYTASRYDFDDGGGGFFTPRIFVVLIVSTTVTFGAVYPLKRVSIGGALLLGPLVGLLALVGILAAETFLRDMLFH